MRYRLIDLFAATTAIAVILPFAIIIAAQLSKVRDWKPLTDMAAVWLIILVGILSLCAAAQSLASEKNNWWAVCGMGAGIVLGVVAGRSTRLGEWAVDRFNPDLVRWEWEPIFGGIIGAVIGAFFGAVVGGIARIVVRKTKGTA